MSGNTQAGAQLVRYLLGLVSSSERERFETEYFKYDDAFAEMLIAEDDLMDAYARGELSANERRHFEARFLNTRAGQERVHFARALAGFLPDRPSSEKPVTYSPGFFASLRVPSMALCFAAVALLVLVAATSWLLIQQSRMRNELQALRSERNSLNQKNEQLRQAADAERTRNGDSAAEIEKLQQQLAQRAPQPENRSSETHVPRGTQPVGNNDQKYARKVKSGRGKQDAILGNNFGRHTLTQLPTSNVFDLSPSTTRSQGSTSNTITLPKNAKEIVFRLGLENAGHEYYRAFIETADGDPVRWFDRFKSPTHSAHNIQLPRIPASELPAGVYVLSLQGLQPDGSFVKVADYSFTVNRTE